MKIKECRINRYGPLTDIGAIPFSEFSLIFGPNESGKTLLVDAIIKILLHGKTQQRKFVGIDRVAESPDGYVILEWEGTDHKLPEIGDMTKVVGVSAEYCRNIFIVRSSDLSVADQASFYTGITDRLMGLHTQAIRLLKKQLQEIGCLTKPSAKANLANREGWGHLGSRVSKGRILLESVDLLQERLREQGYEELENQMLEAEQQLLELNRESELLAVARQKMDYEDAAGTVAEIRGNLRAVQKLETFTDERRQNWRDAERDQIRLGREIEELETAIGERKARKKDLRQLELGAEKEYQKLQRRCEDTAETSQKIEGLIDKRTWWEGHKYLLTLVGRVTVGFCVLTALALVALTLTSYSLLTYLAGGSLACTVASSLAWVLLALLRGRVDKGIAEVRVEAARCGISSQSIEDIGAAIMQLHGDLEEARKDVAGYRAGLESVERELEERGGQVQAKRLELDSSERQVRDIQAACDIKKRATFERKLCEREDIESEIDKRTHFLTKRLGSTGGEIEANLEYWQEQVEATAPALNGSVIPTYDEHRAKEVESQRSELEEGIEEISGVMAQYDSEMDDVGREATSVLSQAEPVLVGTSQDLAEVKKAVAEFVCRVEARKELCLEAIGLLEEIEREEAQQVATLFGTSSDISDMFGEITGGRYQRVGFDPETENVWVETDQKSRLEASWLSKGTYDQLYLAIRLSLAKRLLGDEPGFLLLDDPFLASDSERLGQQMQVLRDLVGDGWQIIYLTVKDEIRRNLSKDIKAKKVQLHKLSRLTA